MERDLYALYYPQQLPIEKGNSLHLHEGVILKFMREGSIVSYGIFVHPLTPNAHIHWSAIEVPFVLLNTLFLGENDSSLTVADDVIVKFYNDTGNYHYGNLINHDGSGVYFTSFRDDALGGDTNEDGGASFPHVEDWDGIYNWRTFDYHEQSNIFYDCYSRNTH